MQGPGCWLLHSGPVAGFGQAGPGAIPSRAPSVNRTVNSGQPASDCNPVFPGRAFRPADGSSAGNIAFTGTYNNTTTQSRGHRASGEQDTIARTAGGHVLGGGQFTSRAGTGTRGTVSGLAGSGFLPQ